MWADGRTHPLNDQGENVEHLHLGGAGKVGGDVEVWRIEVCIVEMEMREKCKGEDGEEVRR